MKTILAERGVVLPAIFALTALIAPGPVFAQQTVIGRVKNFSISPDFHPAPNESQMKSLLQGAEAVPAEGGRVIGIKEGKLQTFSAQGKRELLVETPECVYDSVSRNIRSSAELRAQTADGKFAIEGKGFVWATTNSSLFISNAVRTFVHPDLMRTGDTNEPGAAPSSAEAPEGILIESDTFRFLADEGTGIYRRNVRVQGTNLSMSAGVLTIRVPTEQRQIESIAAEQAVTVDYGEIHATGDRALYLAQTGIINVTGQSTWSADQREGRADAVTIDRSNRVFVAKGNGWLRIPGQTLGPAGVLAAENSPARQKGAGNSFLEIRADNYELRTNWGVFQKNVRVVERRGEEAAGTMNCGELHVSFSGTNRIDELVAESGVVIRQEDKTLSGEKAVYTERDGVLVLTGSPSWEYGRRSGKGDELRVKSREQELAVVGNASMRLPAEEFGELTALPGQAVPTAKPETAAAAPREAEEYADVYSESYTFKPTEARFVGGVYISHPRVNWACEDLTVNLSKDKGPVESILAEQGVSFDLLDRSGQKVHGTGQRAVYTYAVKNGVTNDVMEIMGNPATLRRADVESQTTNLLRNRILIFDRAHNLVGAPGQYSIQGWGKVSTTSVLGSGGGPQPKQAD